MCYPYRGNPGCLGQLQTRCSTRQATALPSAPPEWVMAEAEGPSVAGPSVASAEAPTRHKGVTKWFNATKGYGFVTPVVEGDEQPEEIFVHQVCSEYIINVIQYL